MVPCPTPAASSEHSVPLETSPIAGYLMLFSTNRCTQGLSGEGKERAVFKQAAAQLVLSPLLLPSCEGYLVITLVR